MTRLVNNHTTALIAAVFFFLFIATDLNAAIEAPAFYQKQPTWADTLMKTRAALQEAALADAERGSNQLRVCEALKADFPVAWDWAHQDSGGRFSRWFDAKNEAELARQLIVPVLDELRERATPFRQELELLSQPNASPESSRWWDLYLRACELRRTERLKTIQTTAPRIIFTKRRTLQPSFFAYTEGQSDAQHERHFRTNSALCLWTLEGSYGQTCTLLADPGGAIRDPGVSWDGKRVLFAWKKSLNEDDYHLYELAVNSGQLRQFTSGQGFADYEPAYLPNGDIVFASTRCVQTVDCWWTEVSNLYTCGPDGQFLRRLGFDQVHAIYPQVLEDGRVIYTRWDYNDRSQMFPQALFQMNADGTGQTEFYKNNSWFPTTVAHARGIPGTQKVLAVFMGHHTAQAGKLGILDPSRGRQENAGAQLIAPVRDTPAERIDYYGQEGALFQYPFPLTETEFLVGCAPLGWQRTQRPKGGADFGIYWMDIHGRRELLITDATLACQQPVPLIARARPPIRPNTVDHQQSTGTCYVQDIYSGPSLAGVPRGTVKKLRVIALEFRAAGVGNNGSIGPSGEALVSTPISIGNGSWDVKIVLGDAKVHEDGSAFFKVPVRTPVYFQALDDQNHAIQTMRSWSTLQPGENQSCVGCHENKNTAPIAANYGATRAFQAGPQVLEPFYGPPRGFSFPREVQPLLDRHCIRCHNDRQRKMPRERLANAITRHMDPVWTLSSRPRREAQPAATPRNPGNTNQPAFSLLGEPNLDKVAKRFWSDSYLNLTLAEPSDYYEAVGAYFGVFDGRIVNWIGAQSIPTPLPPYAAGACRSDLIPLLTSDHYGVKLSREELDKLACWIDLFAPFCGDYTEANAWSTEEMEKYQGFLAKRRAMEALEKKNIEAMLAAEGTKNQ